jgi:imidazolonepropionase-like amidohydrolase
LSPIAAIHAATGAAADLLDTRDIGRVEPGCLADLVVVRGNPADDITALSAIDAVLIGGAFAAGDGAPAPAPD